VFLGDFFLKMRKILSYLTNFKVKIYENKRKSKPPNLLKWFFRGALYVLVKFRTTPKTHKCQESTNHAITLWTLWTAYGYFRMTAVVESKMQKT